MAQVFSGDNPTMPGGMEELGMSQEAMLESQKKAAAAGMDAPGAGAGGAPGMPQMPQMPAGMPPQMPGGAPGQWGMPQMPQMPADMPFPTAPGQWGMPQMPQMPTGMSGAPGQPGMPQMPEGWTQVLPQQAFKAVDAPQATWQPQREVTLARAPGPPGAVTGIGTHFTKGQSSAQDPYCIFNFTPGAPAAQAAAEGVLREGEWLHAVNGTFVYDLTNAQVRDLIKGPPGSTVGLVLSPVSE